MADFQGKKIKQVNYSPIQKEGATNENKAVIVAFTDDTQKILNGGLSTLTRQGEALAENIAKQTTDLGEINDLKDLIKAL